MFGRKDAQQLAVIVKMVRELNMPVQIVPGEIVREPDGLAMSSRNIYLDAAQRRQARCLRQALLRVEQLIEEGEVNGERLRDAMREVLAGVPQARPDYIDIVDEERFLPVSEVRSACLALLAVRFGTTRLLDNTRLVPPAPRA